MIKHFAIISFLSLIIGSCGGSGDNIKIDEFNITGTSDDLEDGRAPIDPAINSGMFGLTWRVDDDNAISYTARFYLSVNSNFSEDNDIRFATIFCDDFSSCDHDKRNHENCYFTNDLVMYCGDEDEDVKHDVDDVVDSLPMDAYIIIEACTTYDCDTEKHLIRLQ
ncbi:MAG: hypothetical protein KZQ96_18010 [Candidatus Thiodiazotropha sp. (ex Lucinoma borealis)]|nr:hypothetical protein [Candidatus Thiodiazotropha sp. (ex Lucinoma borealis)]MCU7869273.1 hypothetical protein [Candidatus Thiodiazotropha sp. (ex Lucinoma borealis)]